MFGDLYSTLTFSGAYADTVRGAQVKAANARIPRSERPRKRKAAVVRWGAGAIALVLLPIVLLKGMSAVSSFVGNAAQMSYAEPFKPGGNDRP
ncbi:hypothetical protein OEW28_02435 [Defluviimonas sp. WL0002]|uniref:Uncharacterized protein n=1 Tax=Albidovulum marisflavi TaxID=2984159 RepID=A0ABT2Z9M6_9RHOB|nr:hypothetical protein [Defluviimonas sp. WL0002]MCV2867481.1 hypothetical protein [Defluviimonas sp. WL0002]